MPKGIQAHTQTGTRIHCQKQTTNRHIRREAYTRTGINTDIQAHAQTGTYMQIQTYQTQTGTNKPTGKQAKHKQALTHTYRQTYRHIHIQTNIQAHAYTGKHNKHKQSHTQTDRQTYRHIHKQAQADTYKTYKPKQAQAYTQACAQTCTNRHSKMSTNMPNWHIQAQATIQKTNGHMHRQANRQAHIQTNRHIQEEQQEAGTYTGNHTGRQSHTHT